MRLFGKPMERAVRQSSLFAHASRLGAPLQNNMTKPKIDDGGLCQLRSAVACCHMEREGVSRA